MSANHLGNLALVAGAGIFLIAGGTAPSFALAALAGGVLIKYAMNTLHHPRRRHRRRRRRPQ